MWARFYKPLDRKSEILFGKFQNGGLSYNVKTIFYPNVEQRSTDFLQL